jgi:hypothetical protein
VAEERKIRHRIKQIQKLALWQLVLIFLISVIISASLLRLNNVGMVQRRDAVIEADKQTDSAILTNRLYDLQSFVSTHMNTDLGQGVELSETYKRDEAANIAATQTVSNINIYKQANDICQAKNLKVLSVYRQCVYDYLNSIPSGQVVANSISTEQQIQLIYIHNYISPLWSADFAGFSVLISILILLLIIIRILAVLFLHLMLKKYYKSV